jgi:ankyrin repeat protein
VAGLAWWSNAQVNAKNDNHWTPLHKAAEGGQNDVAELLLAKGAEVNAKDMFGETPLRRAAAYGRKDVVELLRQRGGHE